MHGKILEKGFFLPLLIELERKSNRMSGQVIREPLESTWAAAQKVHGHKRIFSFLLPFSTFEHSPFEEKVIFLHLIFPTSLSFVATPFLNVYYYLFFSLKKTTREELLEKTNPSFETRGTLTVEHNDKNTLPSMSHYKV